MAEIENLSISITTSADKTTSEFDKVTRSTEGLRITLSSLWAAIRNVGGAFSSLSPIVRLFQRTVRGALGAVGSFISGIARIARFRIYRTLIKDLGQSFKDLYGWSKLFGTQYANSMDTITTSLTYLRNSIAALAAPLINALAPVLDTIIDRVVEALNWFNELFAALTFADKFTVAKKVATSFGDAISSSGAKAKKAADDIKRSILGFDEINKLTAPKDSSSGGSDSSPYSKNYEKMFEERDLSSGFKKFSNALERSISDSLSRIGMIVSGASLAIGALLALSGVNVPLGIGLIAAGVTGIAAVLSWNAIAEETYGSLKKVIGIASMGSLAVGLILALSGAAPSLGIGMIAAGISGAAATINWSALNTDLYTSMKSINKIISMGSMAVGAILLFAGVNKPLGLGLIAGGIAGAAADMDWTSLSVDLYGSMKGIMKIVSMGSVAIGAILLFAGVNKALGLGLVAGGIAGIAANLDWSSLDSDVYSSMKRIYNIATRASLVLGIILALTGVNTPLGIGLMAAGAVGTAASLDWDSLKNKVVGKWDEIKENVLETWGKMKTGASDMSEWVQTKVTTAWSTIGAWTSSKWTSVKNTTSTIWGNLKVGASDMTEWVKNKVTTAWDNASLWTSSKWTSIKTTASEIWDNMKENSTTTFSTITETIGNAWDGARIALSGFGGWISSGFKNLWENAWTSVVNAFGGIFSNIKDKVKEPINDVIGFLNSLITKVEATINRIRSKLSNAIKIDIPAVDNPWPWPDFPGIFWQPLNLPDISIKRIKYLAYGGIVDGATMIGMNGYNPIVAGEAGREAVLPLDNHTEWMDELSDRISNNSDVVRILNDVRNLLAQINNKEFSADITTASINNAQRRQNRRAGTAVVPMTT